MGLPESRLLLKLPLLTVEELTHEKRLIVHRGVFSAVCLVFYLPSGEEYFLTVRQYRTAASAVFYEHPAGMIEPSEDPIEGALRELAEETGWLLTKDDIIPLTPHSLYPSPAIWREEGYFFAARLQVPKPLIDSYQADPIRETKEEQLRLAAIPKEKLPQLTRNLQTIAHTFLYYAHFGAPDGKLPSLFG
ncbi:MAG: NUDIX hydrolase [Bacteroidia bacterium]|nr:NUDIX hydrolase [Bacteroidia bacterium]